MGILIGIDIGTQGLKAVAINEKGDTLAIGYSSYELVTPQPGWSEQDPNLWVEGLVSSLGQLWEQGIRSEDIVGIGISGQMHSLVLLDKDKQTLGRAILWNDVRTSEECNDIELMIGRKEVHQITRNAVLPGFTAPKLLWIKKNEPDRYAQIAHFMLPKDFLVFKLSDQLSGDVSDASGTSLFDVGKREWSQEIIRELNIPFEWLGEVKESKEIVGKVTKEAAEVTGLKAGIPIVAGAGDNAAGALGNGVFEEGKGIVSVGTSGTVFVPLQTLPTLPQNEHMRTLHVFCHCLPNTWHAMGVTLSAGLSLKWFKDTFSTELSYDELLKNVPTIPAGANGLTFLPYLNGERTPHNDPDIRGVFHGIGLQHNRDHFARAVIEGVGFSLRDCLELIQKLDVKIDTLQLTGGVVKSTVWRQILSNILGFALQVHEEREGPAYGAAILAGLGTGVINNPFQSEPAIATAVNHEEISVYDNKHQLYKRLYTRVKL
jgi:xylulokinase